MEGKLIRQFVVFLAVIVTCSSFPFSVSGQTIRNCGTGDFEAGINSSKTTIKRSLDRRPAELDFNITTNSGQNCLLSRTLTIENLKIGDFESPPGYGNSTSFSAYEWGSVRHRNTNDAAKFYIIVGEDAEITGKANFKGVFLRFPPDEVPSGQIMNTKFRTLEEYFPLDENDISYPGFIARYNALNAIRGKAIEGGVIVKRQYSIKVDMDIDYTGSEVGERSEPFSQDGGPPWKGLQKQLPKLENSEIVFQFWRSERESTNKSDYKFYKSVKLPIGTNPSQGVYETKTELADGNYFLTSFIQITFDGTVVGIGGGYTAQMLVGVDDETISKSGITLDNLIGDSVSATELETYLGLINRGRMDLFIAEQQFKVSQSSTSGNFNPVYKWSASTRDVYTDLFGDCSITKIVAAGDLGDILSKMTDCLFTSIFRPMIDWATQLVQDAAGVSYLPKVPVEKFYRVIA